MIVFKTVRFKNFGSFGNTFTEINLNDNRMTLVSGGNGNGKSFALLDSITFGLFGKPFRKINIPQLPNSINRKGCVVEIEFSIGSNEYKVIRGLGPKKFEIYKSGEMINQDAKAKDYQKMLEEQILKMNYKSFTQVVILGSSSFVPFMQLTAADRRSVIEDILDINIFSGMNSILKGKISILKDELTDKKQMSEIEKIKIEKQKSLIETIKTRSKTMTDSLLEEISTSNDQINSLVSETEELSDRCNSLIENLPSREKIEEKSRRFDSIEKQLNRSLKSMAEQIDFYENEKTCPTCKQEITEETRKETIQKKNGRVNELNDALSKLAIKKENLIQDLNDVREKSKEIESLQKRVAENQTTTRNLQNYIEKIKKQISEIESGSDKLDEENKTLQEHFVKSELLEGECRDIKVNMSDYDFIHDLLKDSGIKSKIIKHYLPHTNKLINKYLTSMNFYANFSLDENFNETIKSRHRDEFSYMSFSEGEKMRIDLALLLAWREIAAMKNSVNTNILILDEVFDSSLDSVGTEEFTKLLETLALQNNVFVISHKADQLADKFPNHMKFEKKNNFSRLVKDND